MPRRKPGYKYSAAQKKRILTIAREKNLTGPQVKKRFGVSVLTFNRWRGPVRGLRTSKPGRTTGGPRGGVDLRSAVRAHVQQVLPGIIQEQIEAYLAQALATPRRRGRPPGRSRKAR